MAFMKDVRTHFEWAFEMWMMNKDFPHPGAGVDALFGSKTSRVVTGGYYFCPPAPKLPAHDTYRGDDDFFGCSMFAHT
jgi:deferrochelatase/peroxidase EfeB